MFDLLLTIICGYTLVACVVFLLAYFWVYPFDHPPLAKLGLICLLGGMVTSQTLQLLYLTSPEYLFASKLYSYALLFSALGFFLFSRELLASKRYLSGLLVVQATLIGINPWLDNRWIVPLSFGVGVAYATYFMAFVLQSRKHYKRQSLELIMYALFVVMAVVLLIAAVASAFYSVQWLLASYALLVGGSVFSMHLLVLKFPYFITDTEEAARTSYASTTLAGVDKPAMLARLHLFMGTEKAFLESGLTMSQVATQLGLSTHQLSELVNHELEMGFSQLLRKYRVDEAKRMLQDEPEASVLAIGLSVGFASQSNFYSAFKEIEGVTPGGFRKALKH